METALNDLDIHVNEAEDAEEFLEVVRKEDISERKEAHELNGVGQTPHHSREDNDAEENGEIDDDSFIRSGGEGLDCCFDRHELSLGVVFILRELSTSPTSSQRVSI